MFFFFLLNSWLCVDNYWLYNSYDWDNFQMFTEIIIKEKDNL